MRWLSRSHKMLSAPFASLLASLLLVLPAAALSTTGTRLLVIDEGDTRTNYNGYIWDLEQRGFEITTLSPKSADLELFTFGERNYDHVLLLPPVSRAYGPKLSTQLLVEFVNKEGNILILLDPASAPEQIRDLGRELDVGLAPRGDVVVDHFEYIPNYEENDRAHNIIGVPKPVTNDFTKNYFGGFNDKEELVAFRGTGHTLGNSPLIHPILTAPRTAYSYDPKDEELKSESPWSAGQQLHLTTGVQARNNARVTFVGSAELFTDKFQALDGLRMGPKGYKTVVSNRAFANAVTAWTFQEIGVIRVDEVKHYPTGDPSKLNPEIYRVKSDVTYEITLSEYSYDHWIPYVPPPSDNVQVEFTMLDPYYRLNLHPISTSLNATTFSTNFTTPDQHGIFSFRTNYKRPYLSNIEHRKSVTIRHFAHDEYARSYEISGAWVWLGGIAVTVVGWIGFVALWLYSAPAAAQAKKVTGKKL